MLMYIWNNIINTEYVTILGMLVLAYIFAKCTFASKH